MLFENWADRLNKKRTPVEDDIHFKGDEPIEEPTPVAAPAPAATAAPASIEGSNIELKVMRPATFADVSAIADNLIEGCTVVLNLELLDCVVCAYQRWCLVLRVIQNPTCVIELATCCYTGHLVLCGLKVFHILVCVY